MTEKKEKIAREKLEDFVTRNFNPVPQEWVRIIMEHYDEGAPLPMWGTMWLVDSWLGEKLWKNGTIVVHPEECENHEKGETCRTCEDGEEMAGVANIQDKAGHNTAMYVYDIEGHYVVGIHGAGWDFYDGVWDKIYQLIYDNE